MADSSHSAVLLGIAVTRPVMGVFFATSRLTGLQPQQFLGVAFWIGFSISTLIGNSGYCVTVL
jgi:zinc transporter ZupT